MNAAVEFEHEPKARRFVAKIGGAEAVADYRIDADGVLDIYRTFTPVSLRGQRIGRALVEFALDHALREGLRVRPTCPFVKFVAERDSRFAGLRVDPPT